MPVVKVTMPERPNDPEPMHALVFTEGRTDSTFVPISDVLKKMNGRREAFFKAERVQSWEIGDEVANPKWEEKQAKLRGGRR